MKGQYGQAVSDSWFGLGLGLWLFNRFGYQDIGFSKAFNGYSDTGFQKDKKKLTDIGFLNPIMIRWFLIRIGSEFNGFGFFSDIGLIDYRSINF